MDTPEADISANQSGRIQPLPAYQEHDNEHDNIQALISTVDPADTRHLPPIYVRESTNSNDTINGAQKVDTASDHSQDATPFQPPDYTVRGRQTVIEGFFDAINEGQDDAIALFISRNLVTANTTTVDGKTPLLAAVATKNTLIVQQLLDSGAEPDAFGVISKTFYRDPRDVPYTMIKRTPLQLAASIGHLPLVKLFMENYHCDDSLVAPDGQIALRLAAANGHREVVNYLPTRRRGGFLRWQTQHKKAILRCKRALKKIYQFLKFFVWDIEKFFLWTCPKHVIVKPVLKGCKWCWEHKKGLGPWCKSQVKQTPERLERFGKCVWKGVKKVPGFVRDVGKGFWEFCTEVLPKLGRWIWSLITKRIPKAIALLLKWVWSGITSTAKALWNVGLKLVSLLHTIGAAIVTFFKELTLQDIWNGICAVFRAIFVSFPRIIWSWIQAFGETSYRVLEAIFGITGEIIWCIGWAVGWLFTYLPKKFWTVLESLGGSFAKAWYEIMVWFRPKA